MVMQELTKDTFKQAINGDTPIVVDFWASWCGPCRMLAPIFEKVERDFEDRLRFAKVNCETSGDIAQDNQVTGIPCLIVFKGGKELGRIVGSVDEETLKNKLNEILG